MFQCVPKHLEVKSAVFVLVTTMAIGVVYISVGSVLHTQSHNTGSGSQKLPTLTVLFSK